MVKKTPFWYIWQNIEGAEKMKACLQSAGFIFGDEVLRQLGILEARHKKNLSKAIEYKEEL